MCGAILSFTSKPNKSGLIGCSDSVSLISKCKCGPPELPEFPERAITCPFFTFNKVSGG